MSIVNDSKFVKTLRQYLNDTDVDVILTSFSKPVEDCNINKRTGRRIMNAPSSRFRKMLTKGSLINYKSVILKFAKYKYFKVGKDAPITPEVVTEYDSQVLNNGNKKHQTIVTNYRILNRNVFGPVLNQEIQLPRRVSGALSQYYSDYNNKPQLTHEEVARTLKYLWDNCHFNRDHVYKMILIYYSGLRHLEAEALTFGDIIDGWSRELGRIIIIVRRGKNKMSRNVLLFKGAPTIFFERYLIPYLDMKILQLMQTQQTMKDILETKIFSKSTYQCAQKEFKKALKIIVRKFSNNNDDDENERDLSKMLKGAGLHSIRADYSTRVLGILYKYSNEAIYFPLKMVGFLLGHKNKKVTFNHYINLGYNFEINTSSNKLITKLDTFEKFNQENATKINNNNNVDNNKTNIENLVNHLSLICGKKANEIFKDTKRNQTNLNIYLNLTDNMDIFAIDNEINNDDIMEIDNEVLNENEDDIDNNNDDDESYNFNENILNQIIEI